MAIFGNKKKSVIERLDELLAEIDRLPEDEQEKVWAHFDEEKEDAIVDKSDTEDGIANLIRVPALVIFLTYSLKSVKLYKTNCQGRGKCRIRSTIHTEPN